MLNSSENSTQYVGVDIIINVVLLAMNLLNLMSHCCGCYLLTCIYTHGRTTTTQLLFLIHLSFIEAIRNLLSVFIGIFDFSIFHDTVCSVIQDYIDSIYSTTFYILYYMSMYYLTLDRLLAVRLNLRYSLCCTTRKAKYILVATWLFGITIGLSSVLISNGQESISYESYKISVYLSCGIGYIIIAVVTYIMLFKKYKNSLTMQTRNTRTGSSDVPPTIFKVFFQSKFYISILLVTSFLVFMVIPELVYLFYGLRVGFDFPEDSILIFIIDILFAFSDLIDAYIFIFLKKNVRSLLFRKLHAALCCRNANSTNTPITNSRPQAQRCHFGITSTEL